MCSIRERRSANFPTGLSTSPVCSIFSVFLKQQKPQTAPKTEGLFEVKWHYAQAHTTTWRQQTLLTQTKFLQHRSVFVDVFFL